MVGHNIPGSVSDPARGEYNWTRKNHRAWVCTLLACALMAPRNIGRVWAWLPGIRIPRLFCEAFKLTTTRLPGSGIAAKLTRGLILKPVGETGTSMFGALYSIVAVVALLSVCGEFAMRVRLTKREPSDKLIWWRRGGD